MSSEVSSRRLVAAVVLLALAFTSLTQTGCTRPVRRLGILDELAIQYRDRVWAQRAYNLRFANCNREYADHFKNGFCAGYSDICNGGDGYLPALPPDTYRGYEYQCAEGEKCVDSWFEGYPEGVAAAREEKAGSYHEMHVSQMIDRAVTQDKAANVLPSDVPVSKPSSKLLPPRNYAAKLGQRMPTKAPKPQAMLRTTQSAPAVAKKPKSVVTNPSAIIAQPTARVAKPKSIAPRQLQPKPVAKSVVKKQVEAKSAPIPVKRKPLPPIVTASAKTLVTDASKQPSAQTILPPIVRVKPKTTGAGALPPIVRGNKVDPSSAVSTTEIPLPLSVKTSSETRSASWPVNRK